MSERGHFYPGQKRGFQGAGPSLKNRGGRGDNHGRPPCYNNASANPAAYNDNMLRGGRYNNDPPGAGIFSQPPPPPQLSQPPPPHANPQPSLRMQPDTSGQYQVTVTINPAMNGKQHPNPPSHPPQVDPHSGSPIHHYNNTPPPPPYTPYHVTPSHPPPPPPPSDLRMGRGGRQKPTENFGPESSLKGNRSRMRGNFSSKSLNNLGKESDYFDSSQARGRGFTRNERGRHFRSRDVDNNQHFKSDHCRKWEEIDSFDFDSHQLDCSSSERSSKDESFARRARGKWHDNGRRARGGRGDRGREGRGDHGNTGRGDFGRGRRWSMSHNDPQEREEDSKSGDSDTGSEASGFQDKSYHHRGRGRGGRRGGKWSNQRGSYPASYGCGNKGEQENSAAASVANDKKFSVSLHFKTCFENAATMKENVQGAHKMSSGTDLQLSFEEISLKHKDNKSECKFQISGGSSVIPVKEHVREMVAFLKGRLETHVEFHFKESERGSSKVEESGSKEKSSKNKDEKNVNSAEERSKIKERKKKLCKGEQKETKSKDPCLPVPTTVSFKVEKYFAMGTDFKTFLMEATSDLKIDFDIDDKSISLSKGFSSCEIRTKSKADGKKFTKLIDALHKETGLNVEISTCSAETKLEKTRSAMMTEKSELVRKHDERISQFRQDLRKFELTNAKMEIGDITCKLSEAKQQKKEFLSRFETLYRDMEKLDSSSSSAQITPIKSLFDIECNRLAMPCPVYAHRTEIIQEVKSSPVSIFVGKNGCGKSSQIIQYLFEAGIGNGVIVSTHPERLAVAALAEKVAKDRSVKIGSLVGCSTGVNSKIDSSTKILFATDHWLLDECITDPKLKKYSCIIVDEAHQHGLYTDLILGMIKSCLPQAPDLKIVIISSLSEAGEFEKYFGTRRALPVSNGNFTVNVFHSLGYSQDSTDYEEKAVSKALAIHANEDEGNILVFLSSPSEIRRCCQEFEKRCDKSQKHYMCMPLHDQLSLGELGKIFKKSDNQRKIIFTTKIAETCFSIDDVRYVIDTGVTSDIKYDYDQKINLTKTCPISQTTANYRAKCASHAGGGNCYRLYSQKEFDALEEKTFPEIVRVHLEKALLKLFELGVNVKTFDFMKLPSHVALSLAMETLQQYGTIAKGRLTETGKWISKLSFDPKLGFLISEAQKSDLLYDALVLSAIVTFGSDMSYRNFSETDAEVEERNKTNFGTTVMDAIAWLQAYKTWSGMPPKDQAHWCQSKSVDYKLMKSVSYCVEEAMGILRKDFNVRCSCQLSDRADALAVLKKLYMGCKNP